jgi:predicted nucleic acid-binding Zn ribbon protein
MKNKECLVCGKEIKNRGTKYCSQKCAYEGHRRDGHPWRAHRSKHVSV